jgi:hypothetical protein
VPDDLRFSDFTAGEKARIVVQIALMTKGGNIRGPQRRIERIEDAARRRKQTGK